MKCRVCNQEIKEVFSLGELCVSDFIKIGEDPIPQKSELKMMFCNGCGLAQLEKIVPPDSMYGKYWYRSGMNDTMKKALNDVVVSSVDSIPTQEGDIFLDIACNDGTMLASVPRKFRTVGIDPADGTFSAESQKNADIIIQDYFSAKVYNQLNLPKAKIITIIAMFYDLDNPSVFLDDILEIMDDEGLLVIQMSYTPLMINQLAFDNICHEHVCYYSLETLQNLLNQKGLRIIDCTLNDVNGGSFRVFIRKDLANPYNFRTSPYRDVAKCRVDALLQYEKNLRYNTRECYLGFFEKIKALRKQTTDFILSERAKGKRIWGYGASTKGNTLLQWYELDASIIEGIAEKSPYKFGYRTVGTNIPIYNEQEMQQIHPDYLLILPWHFVHEFRNRESKYLKSGGKFIIPCPKFEVIEA